MPTWNERAARLVVLLTAVMACVVVPSVAWLIASEMSGAWLFDNANTWRDFPIYRNIAEGFWPIEGPTTTIGGRHGFLGFYWFGLWTRCWPGYASLQLGTLAVFVPWLVLCWNIARRFASAPAARVGMLALGGTFLGVGPAFPSHVMLMPVTYALGMWGLLHAREKAWGQWVFLLGMVLLTGCHRSGMLHLGLLTVLSVVGLLGSVRRGWPWLTVVAFVGMTWAANQRAPSEVGSGGRLLDMVREARPWETLVAFPTLQVPGMLPLPIVALTALGVYGCWWKAWNSPVTTTDRRGVLLAYAIVAVLFIGFLPDPHYWMPSLSLLPAVIAMGTDAVMEGDRPFSARWPTLAIALGTVITAPATAVGAAWAVEHQLGEVRAVRDEVEVVRLLDEAGVRLRDVEARGRYERENDRLRFHHLFRLLSSAPADAPGREDVCVFVVDMDREPSPGVQTSMQAGALRVDLTSIPDGGCSPNIEPYAPPIRYLDERTLDVVSLR
jgi:hypothetical protein